MDGFGNLSCVSALHLELWECMSYSHMPHITSGRRTSIECEAGPVSHQDFWNTFEHCSDQTLGMACGPGMLPFAAPSAALGSYQL